MTKIVYLLDFFDMIFRKTFRTKIRRSYSELLKERSQKGAPC